jgi:hypothetical protein
MGGGSSRDNLALKAAQYGLSSATEIILHISIMVWCSCQHHNPTSIKLCCPHTTSLKPSTCRNQASTGRNPNFLSCYVGRNSEQLHGLYIGANDNHTWGPACHTTRSGMQDGTSCTLDCSLCRQELVHMPRHNPTHSSAPWCVPSLTQSAECMPAMCPPGSQKPMRLEAQI